MTALSDTVLSALRKAQESAILAVEIYNKPAIKFKSSGYIALMSIAWTSLFHAIFHKRGMSPYYKDSDGNYKTVDGDYKCWELKECLKHYYESDSSNPVRKNLEFFIPLRNRIEHRFLPEIDSDIFGECQAMLLNFDEMIISEFGEEYAIRQCLSFALQLYPSSQSLTEAVKSNKSAASVSQFIENYRSSITTETLNSGKYSFKAFLIQVANHKSKETLPIQFIHWDQLSDEDKTKITPLAALVKEKRPAIANADTYRVGVVCDRVQKAFDNPKLKRGKKFVDKFSPSWHTRCWKHYKVRPESGNPNPENTDIKYCIYDKRHGDYGYTEAWIQFLIKEFSDDTKYQLLFPNSDE